MTLPIVGASTLILRFGSGDGSALRYHTKVAVRAMGIEQRPATAYPLQETTMSTPTTTELTGRHCQACEGGVPKLTPEEVRGYLTAVTGWSLTADGQRIARHWRAKDFLGGMAFFEKIAHLAEAEGHHPDLHLTGYRNVAVELWTHAVGGLTENDFILAAKIDALPGPAGK
jgi:4a-hydroxytetrahydrobiopterin dehydratase